MSLFNAYMSLSGAIDADVRRDERLAHHTTYRIGGPAGLFVTVHSYAALLKVVSVLAEERVEWVILGKGSNVLAADAGYDGCVIVLDDEFSRIQVGEGGLLTAGAGALLSRAVNEALKAELSGLESCVGIPGTVGGAVSMDAGTRREWIGQRVRDVVTLRPGEGLHRYEASGWGVGYRCVPAPSEIVWGPPSSWSGARSRPLPRRWRRACATVLPAHGQAMLRLGLPQSSRALGRHPH